VIKRGKQTIMDFKGAFSSINDRKEENHAFWGLN